MRKIVRLTKTVFAMLLLVTLFSGCDQVNRYQTYTHQILGPFDTVTQVVAYCKSDQEFQLLKTILEERLEELSGLYTIYDDDSEQNNIKTINDHAGIAPVSVGEEILDLLKFAESSYQNSNHQVDVTLGPVLAIWHDYRERGLANPALAAIPELALLQQASEKVALSKMVIDEDANTVFLEKEGMSLDVGAIAKGYAAQRIVDELKNEGFHSMVLTMGGNVVAVGKPLDGKREQWRVGVQNPENSASQSDILDIVLVTDMACVTSGDYQRFYMADGERLSHIIDPKTLFPAKRYKSVTILHPDAGVADLLSTAIFILPYEEGLELAERYGAGVIWVMPDNAMKTNEAYQKYSSLRGE